MSRARLIVLGVLAVVFASGGATAFTASNTVPATTTAGFGSSTVSGATATSIVYTLNANGTQIVTATIKLNGDFHTGFTVQAGFNGGAMSTCTVGAFDGTLTTVACTGYSQVTTGALSFEVAVTNT